jgi:hypothetical protein
MTKTSPTKYSGTEASARLDKTSRGAFQAPYRLLKMTATMKRRALKKTPGKLEFIADPVSE